MNRRRVLTGLLAAPLVVRTTGLLMPVRAIWTARELEMIRKGWELRNGFWWRRVAMTVGDARITVGEARVEWAVIAR